MNIALVYYSYIVVTLQGLAELIHRSLKIASLVLSLDRKEGMRPKNDRLLVLEARIGVDTPNLTMTDRMIKQVADIEDECLKDGAPESLVMMMMTRRPIIIEFFGSNSKLATLLAIDLRNTKPKVGLSGWDAPRGGLCFSSP